MSRITITIDTDNDAFQYDAQGNRPEVTRILHELADRFSYVGDDPTRVNDINGNGVCKVEYQD